MEAEGRKRDNGSLEFSDRQTGAASAINEGQGSQDELQKQNPTVNDKPAL